MGEMEEERMGGEKGGQAGQRAMRESDGQDGDMLQYSSFLPSWRGVHLLEGGCGNAMCFGHWPLIPMHVPQCLAELAEPVQDTPGFFPSLCHSLQQLSLQ